MHSALGTNTIKELATIATENDDFAQVLGSFKRKLNITEVFTPEFKGEVKEVQLEKENKSPFQIIVDKGIIAKKITKKGNHYSYAGEKFHGLKTFIDYLKSNPTIFLHLTLEVDE